VHLFCFVKPTPRTTEVVYVAATHATSYYQFAVPVRN